MKSPVIQLAALAAVIILLLAMLTLAVRDRPPAVLPDPPPLAATK